VTTVQLPWKAIVFDFDGTLAALNIDFSRMRAAVFDLLSHYRIPAEEISQPHVLEMVEEAQALLSHRHPHEGARFLREAMALIAEIELTAASEGKLLSGTRPLLTELNRGSVKIGVITRNCFAAVCRVFPDIHRFCNVLLTREDPYRVKPHPDQLQAALARLECAPAHAAMVGDHPIDVRTGREAGAFTIGVLTGNSSREELSSAHADLIVAAAEEILALPVPLFPAGARIP
jgi:phosphoglycolate phosphatase